MHKLTFSTSLPFFSRIIQIFGDTASTCWEREGLAPVAVLETSFSRTRVVRFFLSYPGQHGSTHGVQQSSQSNHGVAIDGRLDHQGRKGSLVDPARRFGPSQRKGRSAVLLVYAPKGRRLDHFGFLIVGNDTFLARIVRQ